MPLRPVSLDDLVIDDESSLRGVALYARLKRALRESAHRFLLLDPPDGKHAGWDRALFLNLTFWDPEGGADVLCEAHLPADVVAHAAWHHLAARALAVGPAATPEAGTKAAAESGPAAAVEPGSPRPAARALFLAEAIASAFDLYLLGRLLPIAADADFVTSQVPIMREAAEDAGLDEAGFAALLAEVAREPERAFEELRALLFDAACTLFACRGPAPAQAVLEGLGGRRFAPLLHHYQLSNWILYARAYAGDAPVSDAAAAAVDAALRGAPDALAWLEEAWLDGPGGGRRPAS